MHTHEMFENNRRAVFVGLFPKLLERWPVRLAPTPTIKPPVDVFAEPVIVQGIVGFFVCHLAFDGLRRFAHNHARLLRFFRDAFGGVEFR